MILISLGTLDWDFTRLMVMTEELIRERPINQEVMAQIGFTDYQTANFKVYKYFEKQQYGKILADANVIITHGGAGNLFEGIKLGKKIISVPRLAINNEHIDDHQIELVNKLTDEGYILSCTDSLLPAWDQLDAFIPRKYDFTNTIVKAIKDYIK